MGWQDSADIYALPVGIEEPRNDRKRAAEIIAGHTREKAAERAGYRPTRLDDLPISYEGIRKEWLTAILSQNVPNAVVTNHTLGPADDGTANRRSIRVYWNKAGDAANLPTKLFCKATFDLPNRLGLAFAGRDYEGYFYEKIQPLLPAEVETPRCYHTIEDISSANSITVLQDTSDLVQYCSWKTKPTLEMCKDQLRTIALIHGTFWKCCEAVMTDLVQYACGHAGLILANGCAATSMEGFRKARDRLPPRLFKAHDDVWPATLVSLSLNAAAPHTLTHNDLHMGNWYQLKNGKMGLQDFQTIGRGYWARDAGYVLSMQQNVEERRKHETALLQYYLEQFELAGGPHIDLQTAWDEIACQMFSVMAYWTMTLTPDTESQINGHPDELVLANIERSAWLLDDHDGLNVIRRKNGGCL